MLCARVNCPDENTLVALAEGTSPSETRAVHARHLDTCSSCRQTIGSMMRLAGTSTTAETTESTNTQARHSLSAADIIAGRYRLERVIGEGGLGVVWAATDVVARRRVALKILKFRYPELDKRVLREARVANVLNHPNIVNVHDIVVATQGDSLALVMDILEGESLDRFLKRRGRLDLEEALRIMQPILSALGAAHALGIVHRDLKPQNIFLAAGGDGTVKPILLDFGLAKLTASEGVAAQTSALTRESQRLGTPHYMAPEQLYGESDIDARTDMWAIGAILFECLAGWRPVPGRTVGQILQSLAVREIPKIESTVSGLPRSFADTVNDMLLRERHRRPTVETVLAEVTAILSGVA